MILTALKELAERENLIQNADFQPAAVRWLVTVGRDGQMHGPMRDTLQRPTSGKGRATAKPFEIPKRSKRTTQDYAEFVVDKAEYVFGWGENQERAQRRHGLYRDEIRLALEATRDEGLAALQRFLEALGSGTVTLARPEELTEGDLVGFLYAQDPDGPRLISSRPLVVAYWHCRRAEQENRSGEQFDCLVSGMACSPVRLHPKIKGIPPVSETKGGVPLTSINAVAFDSYELSGLGCAAISAEAADAYEKALNRLLAEAYPNPVDGSPLPIRNFRLSEDTVVVFWGREEGGGIDLFADSVGRGEPEAVEALYRASWKGRPIDLHDPSAFYALTLSGGQGRGTIRGWLETTLGRVLQNVRQYFDDLQIARPKGHEGKPLPLLALLRQTAVLGKVSNIAPNRAAEMFAAILAGQPFPRTILEAAVRRARAERTLFPDRVALIKAYLLRARRTGRLPKCPEVQDMVDESCPDRAYRLGRLFAVLEKVQEEATNAKATIRDRYYGAASATPIVVFPQLLRKTPHHLPKCTRPRFYEKLLQEICGELLPPAPFPRTMNLEQQGLFAVGYYHERQALFDEDWNKRRNERFFSRGETPTETPQQQGA